MADSDDDSKDEENKMTGAVTLLIYRIAIGPVLLFLLGWLWNQQKEVSRLTEENKALFTTNAQLETWAKEVSKQSAYMDGLKDAILAGATGPREFHVDFTLPTEAIEDTIAEMEAGHQAAAEQQESTFKAWMDQIKQAWSSKEPQQSRGGSAETARPPPRLQQQDPRNQQQQQQQQQQIPDYNQMPQLDQKALEHYRETKTKSSK